jgi:hypothetical protein
MVVLCLSAYTHIQEDYMHKSQLSEIIIIIIRY